MAFRLSSVFCFIFGSHAVQTRGMHLESFDVDGDGLGLEEMEVQQMRAHYLQWAEKHARVIRRVVERISISPNATTRTRERKKAVHLHVHNSGGTFMCETARRFETVTNRQNNCNLVRGAFEDHPFTKVYKYKTTCSMRQSEMQKQEVTLSMIERWFDVEGGDWCPNDFVYTAIMRDPLARARTTLRLNEHGMQEKVLLWLQKGDPEQRGGWLHSHAAYNDFVVRTLNGPDAMLLPLGALNETHLQIAKDMLQAFDAVLAIPTLSADYFQLVEALGWDPSPNRFDMQYSSQKSVDLDSELQTLLERHNKLDMELYNFAVELAASKTGLAMQKLGA